MIFLSLFVTGILTNIFTIFSLLDFLKLFDGCGKSKYITLVLTF